MNRNKNKLNLIANIITILIIVMVAFVSIKIGDYICKNNPHKNSKPGTILFRH